MKTKLYTLALGAFFVPAALFAGCGGVPGNSVADGRRHLDREERLRPLADGRRQVRRPGRPPRRPSRPTTRRASTRSARPRRSRPRASRRSPTRQLKTQCKQEYDALRDQVLQLLISFEWIEGEAERAGRSRSPTPRSRSPSTSRRRSRSPRTPTSRSSSRTPARPRRTSSSASASTRSPTRSARRSPRARTRSPTPRSRSTTTRTRQRFAQPERRDLRIVLTKTQGQGRRRPRRRSRTAQSFKSVAKKYSIDQASKAQGGKLPAVAKGQQEKALDDAIFKAKKGELTGPVKTQFGYYVFEVTKVTPATQQTLEQAKATIKQMLASQNQQKALDKFVKYFRKRWKEKTDCREGYRTQDCKNAPKATPTPTPAGGGPPARSPLQPSATPEGALSDPEGLRSGGRAPRRAHAPAARGVPVGPRAGRALDRPAHGRGGLRAGRRRPRGRRRQAARRARRRALPGPLPVAAARGARRGLAGRGRRALPPEADPPPSARLRRRRGRARRRGAAQLGRDQARRARPRAGDLRRGAREPARAAVRAQGPAARGDVGLRLRPRPLRRGRGRARGAAGGRGRPRRARSTRSATCCSPPSTSRASSRSTRSSRCARPPIASAAASRPPPPSPHARARTGTISRPDAQLGYYAQARLAEQQGDAE